jgi:glycosyltransferase involved in cell wall biosynthesis
MRTERAIKVVFCWAEASGYMSACWRALAARPGVSVHIFHSEQLFTAHANQFKNQLEGLSNEMFDSSSPDVLSWLVEAVSRQRPDVIALCGWIYWPYIRLLRSPGLNGVRAIMGMDSPWRATWTQRLARLRLGAALERCALVVTAGERSSTYARHLGVPEARIRTGYYGFDYAMFSRVAESRERAPWPRRFLFVGRYVAQKDLGTLVAAYARYRAMVTEPWTLTCCGQGPDAPLIANQPGITDIGFRPPAELPAVFADHGAFVMASHFEPWGVVIAEAAASGLPLVCTTACGAALDVVRPYHNGVTVAPRDVDGLAEAMRWMHEHEAELPGMGARSHVAAAEFSADAWAARWHSYMLEALGASPS